MKKEFHIGTGEFIRIIVAGAVGAAAAVYVEESSKLPPPKAVEPIVVQLDNDGGVYAQFSDGGELNVSVGTAACNPYACIDNRQGASTTRLTFGPYAQDFP